ncbi:homeobox-like domain superfamily [Holotrichia oblita]|uniref:Homeobox-like domain superfamily n=1 Tax=Holotrichia oblita TaxID=644536 RepID=A0ACB9STH6_HOLOL|nr:homeobox-like domain superfamily [Holotrichia oblita]
MNLLAEEVADPSNGYRARRIEEKEEYEKEPQDEKLEDAVYLWFVQKRSQGEPISGPLLCEKALKMNKKPSGSEDFKAGTGLVKEV